jgi:hypothetical protein
VTAIHSAVKGLTFLILGMINMASTLWCHSWLVPFLFYTPIGCHWDTKIDITTWGQEHLSQIGHRQYRRLHQKPSVNTWRPFVSWTTVKLGNYSQTTRGVYRGAYPLHTAVREQCFTRKGIFHVTWLILPYLEHNAYFNKIVYSYWANRWWSRWDTTDAAAESVHSGEFPLHYNVDSFCASDIVT